MGGVIRDVMALSTGFSGIVRTLSERNYGIYTAGNGVSLIGTWVQRIAVGWLTWELTRSSTWLGAMAFAELFPSILIGPIAGAVADRVSRLRILAVGHVLLMIQAVALAFLNALELMTVWRLFALVLFGGVVTAFNQPARLAIIPSLVPRLQLSTAVAFNSVVFNLARFIGPAIAGVLIVGGGLTLTFAVNAVSFLAFLVALGQIRLGGGGEEGRRQRRSLLADVGEGLSYVRGHPGIGPMLLLMIVTSIGLRPIPELLPGFADAVFGRGAGGLAALSASIGVGAMAGGLWLAQRGGQEGLARVAFSTSLALALANLGFVATTRFELALVAAAAGGLTMVTSGVAAQTLVQMAVDGAMRGRVMSLYGIVFRGGPAIGAVVLGVLADHVGLRLAVALATVITIGLWYLIWRRRAEIEAALEPQPEPAPGPGGG
jgi:MFS family permease